MQRSFKWGLIILCIVFAQEIVAQSSHNSPYSRYGVGDLHGLGYTQNAGMGGLGNTVGHVLFINDKNPALLQMTKYAAFVYGVDAHWRKLSTTTNTQKSDDYNLSLIGMAFPIGSRWTSGVGLRPYSTKSYNIITDEEIGENARSLKVYDGSGGLNRVNFSNAYRLIDDSTSSFTLSLGLESNYIFGTFKDETSSFLFLNGINPSTFTSITSDQSYRGVSFKPGISLRYQIMTYKRNKTVQIKGDNGELLDTTIQVNSLFPKKAIEEFSEKTIIGKYFILLKGNRGVRLDPGIKISDERKRLKALYSTYLTNDYGVMVLPEAEGVTKDSLDKDFVEVYTVFTNKTDTSKQKTDKNYFKPFVQRKSGIFVNLGATYDFGTTLNGMEQMKVERIDIIRDVVLDTDTQDELSTSLDIPRSVGLGFSVDKPVPTGKKRMERNTWSLGADFSFTNWQRTNYTTGLYSFRNTYGFTLGGSYTPDFESLNPELMGKVKKYFNRVIYRAGFNYQTLPYRANGKSLEEIGINFGVSLPLGTFDNVRNRPKFINLAFTYGSRGTTERRLVKEQFIRASVSFTVNDKWFRRNKLGL